MNILYATRAAVPYPSAASLNTVQMCQGLSRLGHHVTLVLGRKFWRPTLGTRDWSAYFGFRPEFQTRRLWELPRTGYGFDQRIVELAYRTRSLIYLRYPRMLSRLAKRPVPTLLEIHSALTAGERQLVAEHLKRGVLMGVIVITSALRDHLGSTPELAAFRHRFFVAPDAVQWERFANLPLAGNLPRVGYLGSLFPGKGMEQIVQIAARLPGVSFETYGGQPADRRRWRTQVAKLPNLELGRQLKPAEVPQHLSRFGIALLPNQPSVKLPNGEDIGSFTSPMKLFEYMAAGQAIVASDLPVLREVLRHEENCLLVPHDEPQAWADAIQRLQRDVALAHRLAATARHEARERYSYETRFRKIFAHFPCESRAFFEGTSSLPRAAAA